VDDPRDDLLLSDTGLPADPRARDHGVKYLFVHQNFPGQFLHIVRYLNAKKKHDLVFITEQNRNQIEGVRKVPYHPPAGAAPQTHPVARDLDAAAHRAEAVAQTAQNLKQLGYTPDIIIGHHGWGELLNLRDVWPDVPILGYMEFYYQTDAADVGFDREFLLSRAEYPRVRAKNTINHLAFANGGYGLTPTEWQLSTYPAWMRSWITLLREGVDLTVCKPDPNVRRQVMTIGGMRIAPRDKLVTYVARDLEPYRGIHPMMRAVAHMLRARKDIRVVIVGGNGVSYGAPPPQGNWKDVLLGELGDQIDLKRVAFPGRIDYDLYVRMLQRSDAHVYLTYPFVASWSLREALAMGCAVIGSDTEPVREFITHEQNGLLADFFDPAGLAAKVVTVIENAALARSLRSAARRYAERHLSLTDYLTGYDELIRRLTGKDP
jgi:glycosyltransferase involved in cell wall biosynthesis